ncbi:MAG: ABC transporter ATP-binding protein, partial [Chitinophagaceae bacterium]|nr:ABC transporter ATP-binding protein [Chitinophagaceae bacterium]
KNPNFLILDEPTNDLDLPTLSVLEDFLSEYQGCLLIVSHDRYFMDRLTDHLFVFEGAGAIRDFPGNYTQYRLWEKSREENEKNARADKRASEEEVSVDQEASSANPNSRKAKPSYKDKREFQILQEEINALEKEKAAITGKLNDGTLPYEQLETLSARIGEIAVLLDTKELRWLELSEILEGS